MRLCRTALVGLVGVAALAACFRSSGDEGEADSDFSVPQTPQGHHADSGPPDAASPPSCASGIAEELAVSSDGCHDRALERGVWRGRALFPDAPPAVAEHRCAFRWVAPDGTPPTLAERAQLAFTTDGQSVQSCTANGAIPATGAAGDLFQIEEIVGPDGGTQDASIVTGATGCDVCGQVEANRLFGVRTSGHAYAPRVRLVTTTGLEYRLVVNVASDAAAFNVDLPPAPSGTWVEGYVRIE